MALKTVRVPEGMEGPFAEAERIVARYFHAQKLDPEHGTIEIFGERYILVRAASLSVEFFELVESLYGEGRGAEADEFARNILFDLAHAVGKSDARDFHAKLGVTDPIARLSAGPIHFAHAGWAFVDISPDSRPSPDANFFLLYDHPYSFESDAWIRAKKKRASPACIMSAGYSSGWCEESFGVTLVATEVMCRAKGDGACRFIMAHPERIHSHVERFALASTSPARGQGVNVPDFFSRKRMEEELRRAKHDLEERVEHEVEERQKAERQLLQAQKLEAIGRLAGGIAHDFNNVMAVVLGNAGLLARKLPAGDPLVGFVEQIAQAGERAAKLTQQLLAFSRAQILSRQVLVLNDVVRGVVKLLERVIGENVKLALSLRDDAGSVLADRGQIEQVVMNLVVNARDAMPAGGLVTIETSHEDVSVARSLQIGGVDPGAYVRMDVVDVGTGMSRETQAQIFEPFFTTKEAGKGTGLGLSTVYGIVKQLGGSIAVDSAPGVGSRFSIWLPRVGAAMAEAARAQPVDSHAAKGETVLVVEDQDALRKVVRELLEDFGYSVLDAGDAATALAIAREHAGAIDLLLTDVLMPVTSGPELAERFVKEHPATKVLFMSGYADDATLRRLHSGKRAALIAKPFTPEDLARKIRDVLE